VGAAAATSTAVGAGRERDVEPDCPWLGILEQQHMDFDLTGQSKAVGRNSSPLAGLPCDDGDFGAQTVRCQQRKCVTAANRSGSSQFDRFSVSISPISS
jgi:hypothetical protein